MSAPIPLLRESPRDQRTASTYIFGAVCPKEGIFKECAACLKGVKQGEYPRRATPLEHTNRGKLKAGNYRPRAGRAIGRKALIVKAATEL
jgi:hypothetical protein